MIKIRNSNEIFSVKSSWFSAKWHFSFDNYYDPENTSFGSLRVFNDDTLIPGVAWPMYPHRNIETVTYVVEGEFKHGDSLGNDGVLPAGSVMHATIGTGMEHTEINNLEDKPMRFIQIWIMPDKLNLQPQIHQKVLTKGDRKDKLLCVVSNKNKKALPIAQDASVYLSSLSSGCEIEHNLPNKVGAYIYCIKGKININENTLITGDAAKIYNEDKIKLKALQETELLIVQVNYET